MADSGFVLLDKQDRMIVRLEGAARVETASLIKQELAQASITHNVAIDWGGAEHVDASVLQVLLALRKLVVERGLSFMVDKDDARVRGYLKLSGLSEYFLVRDHSPGAPPAESTNA
jgi:anti-anti-sigma factor